MKNSVTRLCLWFVMGLLGGPLTAQQAMNFNYANSFETLKGDKSISARAMAQDDSGYVYIPFTQEDSADIDPGPGVALVTSQSTYGSISFAKYTRGGSLVWVKKIDVDVHGYASQMLVHNGSLYIFGQFRTNADFDPGAGTAYLNSGVTNGAFVAKYTLNGDYVFAKLVASSTNEVRMYDVEVDPSSGRFVIGGSFGADTDFDPSAGVQTLAVTPGNYDGYIASYDTNFTGVSAYRLSGAGSQIDMVQEIEVDWSGNIYIGGYSGSNPLYTNFQNLSAGQLVAQYTGGNAFIAKYNSLFQLQWSHMFQSTAFTSMEAMTLAGSSLYMGLRCDGGMVDFDPGANTATAVFTQIGQAALVMFDVSGTYGFHKVWQPAIPNSGLYITGIEAGSAGVLIGCNYAGTVDIDPNVAIVNLPQAPNTIPVVMLLSYAGNLSAHTACTGERAEAAFISFDKLNSQYFYLGGVYADTLTFGNNDFSLYANSSTPFNYSSYLAHYDLFDAAPDTASKTMTFSNVTDTTMTVSFTKGNGNKRIVIARAVSAVTAEPTDGVYHYTDTVFAMGNDFGNSQYAVYNDTGSSFTVTGLQPFTVYHFTVFEYNGMSGQINYLTGSTLSGSKKTTLNGSTAVKEITESNIWNVYPNPMVNTLTVESEVTPAENAMLTIRDVSGRIMLTQSLEMMQRTQIDVTALASGMYLVELHNGVEVYKTKLIKQ